MKIWEKNLYIVFFAETIAMTGIAFVVPFLPLYVKELGVIDLNQAAFWSGLLVSAPAVAVIFVSPIWGSMADRFGRKPMIVRAFLGAAVTIFLMSIAQNVYQLLILRLFQGALSGTIAACNSLIASSSPENKMGSSLGLLQTGVFVGNFFGPLVGGVSADIFGFQNAFKLTGIILFISGLLVFFFVKENFIPCKIKNQRIPFNKKVKIIFGYQHIVTMFSLLFLLQCSTKAISPILSLFIETITDHSNTLSTVSGLMFALTGFTSAISAINIGKSFEKKPNLIFLTVCFIGAGIFFFSQGLTKNITHLAVTRFFLGLFYGGIIPVINTVISWSVSSEDRGKVFGVANSITFMGTIVGPMLGSLIQNIFNSLSYVFYLTGLVLLFTGLVLPFILKNFSKTILSEGYLK